MLTLYHGSQMSVPLPNAKAGRKNLDFGPGFYLTKIKKQAEDWAVVMALIDKYLTFVESTILDSEEDEP